MTWHYGFGGLRPATHGVDYGSGEFGLPRMAWHYRGIAVLAVGFGGLRARRARRG